MQILKNHAWFGLNAGAVLGSEKNDGWIEITKDIPYTPRRALSSSELSIRIPRRTVLNQPHCFLNIEKVREEGAIREDCTKKDFLGARKQLLVRKSGFWWVFSVKI